ncbi:MAG: diguanylate cyclase (GGDEF)-like protein [Paraglaciecola sp.]
MDFNRSFKKLVFGLFLLVSITVGYAAYLAVSNIVGEQHRLQNESISPVFSLVDREILKPLYISETLAYSEMFNHLIEPAEPDHDVIYDHLEILEKKFNLEFFIASEKHRRQYFSERTSIELIEGEIDWYFKIKAMDSDLLADVGRSEDPQLFFDVKIYNKQNEYIGIVGVAKSLQVFLKEFSDYKSKYGYDFLFLNDNNTVVLSSYSQQLANGADLKNIEEFIWYQKIDQSSLIDGSLNSVLVNLAGDDFLISELYINELKWRLLLLIPLKTKQMQLNKTFFFNISMVTIFGLSLFLVIYWITNKYRKGIVKAINIDELTRLANRRAIQLKFRELKEKPGTELCVIILDIDHFKQVNDTHGHNTGDEILKKIADLLGKVVRSQDVVGRWGGEEFIMLMPCNDPQIGINVAERARKLLMTAKISDIQLEQPITASFGVTHANAAIDLKDIVEVADKALYKAKDAGRNRVKYLPMN